MSLTLCPRDDEPQDVASLRGERQANADLVRTQGDAVGYGAENPYEGQHDRKLASLAIGAVAALAVAQLMRAITQIWPRGATKSSREPGGTWRARAEPATERSFSQL